MMKKLLYVYIVLLVTGNTNIVSAKQSNELQVGPVNLTQNVNGVMLNSNITSFFNLHTTNQGLFLKARIIADLSDLQKKIGQIINTFPLPNENCRSYSGNNPVVKIPKKELLAIDNTAVLNISGNVDMWDCRENPVPNSKVEWKNETVGSLLGKKIKTKVPKVITWPGSPIKNKLASQSFDASLPILVYIKNPQTASLKFGQPNINLKGEYAFITKGILKIAGIDINSEAKKALDKAIDLSSIQQSIPKEYSELHPTIEKLNFYNNNGVLAISMHLTATVPVEKISTFVLLLLNK